MPSRELGGATEPARAIMRKADEKAPRPRGPSR